MTIDPAVVVIYLFFGFLLSAIALSLFEFMWKLPRWLRIVARIVFAFGWLPICVVAIFVFVVFGGIKLFFE